MKKLITTTRLCERSEAIQPNTVHSSLDCRLALRAPRKDNLKHRFALALACLLTSCLAITPIHAALPITNATASTYTFVSPHDAERFSALTDETRCVVCQFQNIAESNAPLAGSLRDKIYQLIQEKKSDDEIKAYLVKRYGEVILLKPRFNPLTAVLWMFPAFAILFFTFLLTRYVRPSLRA